MSCPHKPLVVAYVASPHGGYLEFFRKYAGGALCVVGEDLIEEFPRLTRHLPGVCPADAVQMISSLGIFESVRVVDREELLALAGSVPIFMPDEDVSRALAEKYLQEAKEVTFDASWKLRWDWGATTHQVQPEGEMHISEDELDVMLMGKAVSTAERSPDWWRQVGAVLVRDGIILLTAYNTHLPSEQSAYVQGDPRSNFKAGEHIDASLALHAEVGIIAEAARRGICTSGCDLYVTTFPCPPCANACAESGIRRLFYRNGYSLVAGADALRSRGVKMIRVQTKTPSPE
jgi:dCMP deaminase